jgi:hypothetical protein
VVKPAARKRLVGYLQEQHDVTEIKSVPYVPFSHPFVERLIGTIRREYLDHALFWNAGDLERKLDEYRRHYNAHRVHTSLGGNTPAVYASEVACYVRFPAFRLDLIQVGKVSVCRGLGTTDRS